MVDRYGRKIGLVSHIAVCKHQALASAADSRIYSTVAPSLCLLALSWEVSVTPPLNLWVLVFFWVWELLLPVCVPISCRVALGMR